MSVRESHGYALVVVVCLVGLLLVAWGASGCAAAPDYTPERARVLGSVLLDTPQGEVLVELESGLVIGPSESGISVRQIRVYSEVQAHAGLVSVDYTTAPSEPQWSHCVQATVTLSGWIVQRRFGCDPMQKTVDLSDAEK